MQTRCGGLQQNYTTVRQTVTRLLAYDPETGAFTWKCRRGSAKDGKRAGTIARDGYCYISIEGRQIGAHRLAWLLVYGHIPPAMDHINGDRQDNRISNLRSATASQNMRNRRRNVNNTSSFAGVTWHKRARRWQAQIGHRGRVLYLGLFTNKWDACKARWAAEDRLFGQYSRWQSGLLSIKEKAASNRTGGNQLVSL